MPDTVIPGCFGSTLAFDPKAVECLSCPYFQDCGGKAQENFQLHVTNLEGLDVRFGTTFAERFKTTGAVVKRLRERANSALEAEIAALKASGVFDSQEANPFRGKVAYLELAFLILQAKKQIRRSQLATLMKQKFSNLTPEQAAARASLAVDVLKRMGRATEKNGMVYA